MHVILADEMTLGFDYIHLHLNIKLESYHLKKKIFSLLCFHSYKIV